jgi:MSHA pilin protein MshC
MPARPSLALHTRLQQASAGFTLLEMVIVILLLGILSIYASPKVFNASQMTLDAQARTLASDLQRAQLLATTTGQAFYFCPLSTGYVVQSNATCPASLPAQASTTQPVVVALDKQATLSATPGTLAFNSLGQPSTAGSFQLLSAPSGSGSITVTASAVTGLVSMASP